MLLRGGQEEKEPIRAVTYMLLKELNIRGAYIATLYTLSLF